MIAIVAILATLLLSVLSTAKKKGRIVVCTSNLRQTMLAVEMYRSDFAKPPTAVRDLVAGRLLSDEKILLCPEDRTKNWGRLVQALQLNAGVDDVAYSFLHPLPLSDQDWNLLEKRGKSSGLFACQLHGLGRQRTEAPSFRDFEGLVLRGQFDGAVVRRQVYWETAAAESTGSPLIVVRFGPEPMPWQLFADLPAGQSRPEE